jgi:hypothetical protein
MYYHLVFRKTQMSRHVELHAELKINDVWHHYFVVRIENLEVMHWLGHVENRPRALWPNDLTILTQVHLDMRSVDAHSKCVADDMDIMWLSEYMPNGLCGPHIGYLFGHSWWAWFREPQLFALHKKQGIWNFRWIWWSIG